MVGHNFYAQHNCGRLRTVGLLAERYEIEVEEAQAAEKREGKILTVAVRQKDGSLYCCQVGFEQFIMQKCLA